MRERGSRDGRSQGPGARGGGVARRASGRGRATTTHLQIYSFCTLAHISGRSDGLGLVWRRRRVRVRLLDLERLLVRPT